MGEETITLTQEELTQRVEEAVANATKELEAKHNKAMYDLRQENKNLKNASKSAEDLKKEQDEALVNELNELRAYKKSSQIGERLAKEGLPSYFKNDNRLLNSTDDDFDKVIKTIKKEYEDTLPKGNQNSTVIKTSGQTPVVAKDQAKAEFGQALKELVGR